MDEGKPVESKTAKDNIIAVYQVVFHFKRNRHLAQAVRMTLRDHIILGDGSYYSFKDNKKL